MGETQAIRAGLTVRRLVDALVSVIIAPPCAACGESLEHPTDGAVCLRCWRAVIRLTPPFCDRCGMPLAGLSCGACARHPSSVARARAAGAYEGALREIVHAFKYGGRRSLARPIGSLMIESAGDLLDGVDATVPVPLHRDRLRRRGFNQAELLARELPLPVMNLLARTRPTASQIDLPADRRARNVRGAFAAIGRKLGHHSVLLVDDVVTTGATLNECARVLHSAGVREVRALTAARAL